MLDAGKQVPVDVLVDDFASRLRQGEPVDVEEYAERWPDLAEEIRELFPAVEAMERLKRRKQRAVQHAQLPTKIGDFRVLREIGRGGMGIVYEAVQESLDRRVALKVLPQPMWNERRLRRFRREARTAAKLHHTNIVPVLGVGEDDGHQFIVMQYIRGVGLDDVIASLRHLLEIDLAQDQDTRQGADTDTVSPQSADSLAGKLIHTMPTRPASAEPLPRQSPLWINIARLGAQAAEALYYAHQQGTTHRDVKPGNLLLDEQGNVWVADFGLAIQQEASHSNDIVGTLRYMAPEQLQGSSDPLSDIYSLGITLYELVTLQPAFNDRERRQQLIAGKGFDAPPAPSEVRDCPRDLETIILKSIASDPRHRYQTAEELAEDLDAFIEHRPIRARRVTSAERFARWCRRNKALASATATAAVLLLAVAITATVAYYQTRSLAIAAQESLERETQQRWRAETTLEISLEALDRIYQRFAPDRFRDNALAFRSDDDLELPRAPITPADATMLEQILQVYDRFAEQQADSRRLAAEAARANWRVAEIQRRLGNYDRAVQACIRSIQQYQRLGSLPADDEEAVVDSRASLKSPAGARQAPKPVDAQLAMARVYNELGMTRLAMGQSARAVAAHRAALRRLGAATLIPKDASAGGAGILPSPVSESGDDFSSQDIRDRLFEIARTDYLLMLAAPDHSRGGSTRQLRRAIPLLEKMAPTEVETGDARYLLAVCYAARENDPFGPLTEDSLELLEQLVHEFPEQPDYRFDLVVTCARGNLGSTFQQKRLESRLRRAVGHSRELVAEHPNVRDYVQTHAHVLRRLGALLSNQAETLVNVQQRRMRSEAEQLLRLAVDHQRALADRFPGQAPFRVYLARIQNLLANHLIRMGKYREAQGCCNRIVSQLYGLPAVTTHPILAKTYALLATSHSALDEVGEAADATDNAQFHAAAAERIPSHATPKGKKVTGDSTL